MICFRRMLCKLLLPILAAAPWAAGSGQLVWYRSDVDGTEQAYGVYVPAAPAPEGGFPAIFHGHGYGWSVSAGFSDWQRRWADENGWVLININARGPTFYEGIGQKAVYEVVADACSRFGLNPRRLFFTGASMGGTGAFRAGIRNPDIFAAVASVDGWGDWRLWHHHWYARADMRDDIEEFRRPLLNSVAPLYWAERAMWGRIKAIVDGKDEVVWPNNSLFLARRLSELAADDPATYRTDTVLHYDRGHGGGYDLPAIYNFFLRCAPSHLGRRIRLATWDLTYASQGWLAITQIHTLGHQAVAESLAADGRISVWTKNVSRLEILPAEAPDVSEAGGCQVYVDGRLVHDGAPRLVCAQAVYDADENLVDWRGASEDPGNDSAPQKRPGLAGPIGDALVQPFLVAYATAGVPSHTQRHREEADAFARAWTDFFVHGPGIKALPEDQVTLRDLSSRNLVIFGCLDCSRLLRIADRAHHFPIRVHHDAIIVSDPSGIQRHYRGSHFGAFFVYPNSLAAFQRYILVCSGRWNTRPDSYVPSGLDYDMEKLPWAYPDYVVFNTDQQQLPFVLNVNNKPPVTCYEAAYFVEAGYFDNQWRTAPDVVAAWVKSLKPERARLIHVSDMELVPRPAVRVVAADGAPVEQARVTLGDGLCARSALTDRDGWARFDGFPDPASVELLSVMATGCAYDRTTDCGLASPRAWQAGELAAARFISPLRVAMESPPVRLQWKVSNLTSLPAQVVTVACTSRGVVHPRQQDFTLPPRGERTVGCEWSDGCTLAGPVQVTLELQVSVGACTASARVSQTVEVCEPSPSPLVISEASATRDGESWKISAKVANAGDTSLQAQLRAFVVQAAWPCPDQTVRLDPGEEKQIIWVVPAQAGRWHQGLADVVIYAPGYSAWAKTDIALALPGGENIAALP